MTMLSVLMSKFLSIFLANENVVSAHVNMSKFLSIFLANENVVSALSK
jgi:hypothetical protein